MLTYYIAVKRSIMFHNITNANSGYSKKHALVNVIKCVRTTTGSFPEAGVQCMPKYANKEQGKHATMSLIYNKT